MDTKNQYGYRAWLLRYWVESASTGNDRQVGRFSLEDPQTGSRKGFTDLKSLVNFLQEELKIHKKEPTDGTKE